MTRAGAGVGVGSSGIVSSGCEVMVSILRCQISVRFLSGFTLHQALRVDNLLYLCLDVLQVPLGQAQVPSQVARVWP